MPTQADVTAVLNKLRDLGLRTEWMPGKSHWRVIDPGTGAYITQVSGSPSDVNFVHQIRRAVKRIGIDWESGRRRKSRGRRADSLQLDLEALARAQHMARLHGEREPQVEDLEDKSFLQRIRKGYTDQEAEEAISHMPRGVDAPRMFRTRSRLQKILERYGEELETRARERYPHLQPGKGARREFVRLAMEVGPQRHIKTFTSLGSGEQTLHRILSDEKSSVMLWVANVLEATMDHVEGLEWPGVEPLVLPPSTPPPVVSEPEPATPLSVAQVRQLIMESLKEDWQPRPDIIGKIMEAGATKAAIEKAATQLAKEGVLDRRYIAAGKMQWRLAPPAPIEAKPPPPPAKAMEVAKEPELTVPEVRAPDNQIRQRYADSLLSFLEAAKAEDLDKLGPVLERLDRLAGIA